MRATSVGCVHAHSHRSSLANFWGALHVGCWGSQALVSGCCLCAAMLRYHLFLPCIKLCSTVSLRAAFATSCIGWDAGAGRFLSHGRVLSGVDCALSSFGCLVKPLRRWQERKGWLSREGSFLACHVWLIMNFWPQYLSRVNLWIQGGCWASQVML